MESIDGIILSKNRASQLDLLISSIRKNFKEIHDISVIYTYSDDFYKQGYEKVINKHKNVRFIKENIFRDDYLSVLNGIKTDFMLNFCDDNFILHDMSVDKVVDEYRRDDKIISASLRLSKKYKYCYTQNKYFDMPSFISEDSLLKWDWTKCNPESDWGYPYPIDNNLYSTSYYKQLISQCTLKNPCIEGEINRKRNYSKPHMISLPEIKIITITNNKAQTWGANRCYDKQEYSLENLNKLYLENMIIDAEEIENKIDLNTLNACHIEYDWKFKKDECKKSKY
jgi:hypothetical protein